MAVEKRRFHLMYPCLQKDYAPSTVFHARFVEGAAEPFAWPLAAGVLEIISRRQAQAVVHIQSKILGMSA